MLSFGLVRGARAVSVSSSEHLPRDQSYEGALQRRDNIEEFIVAGEAPDSDEGHHQECEQGFVVA